MWGQWGRANFACLDCRHVVSSEQHSGPICPLCRNPMINMGSAFKAPRKSANLQWRKIERLIAAGLRFTPHCSCCKPWVPVKTLSDVKSQLHQRRSDRKVWSS